MKGTLMTSLFSVAIEHKNDVHIILPEGYIDADAQVGLSEAFQKIKALGATRLLFNFCNTRKINSTGMSQILNILQEAINAGIKVRFSNLSLINYKLFVMIGINEFGEIFTDQEAALQDFSNI